MKIKGISFLIVAIIILSGIGLCIVRSEPKTEYLRIHIRADSNLDADQQVKYQVRNEVVNYLTPFISQCDTKQKAENMLKTQLKNIENVADGVLKENGFGYSSRASIRNEKFPTRVYRTTTLESGFYDALIIELGSGKGDNWWCVVYPPLCFTGSGTGYVYRSKIQDIINDFIKNKEK